MKLDTTAASNPGVVARVLNIAAPAPEPAHVSAPSAASRCPDCGFTFLTAVGCTHCGGNDAPAK